MKQALLRWIRACASMCLTKRRGLMVRGYICLHAGLCKRENFDSHSRGVLRVLASPQRVRNSQNKYYWISFCALLTSFALSSSPYSQNYLCRLSNTEYCGSCGREFRNHRILSKFSNIEPRVDFWMWLWRNYCLKGSTAFFSISRRWRDD